MNDFKKFGGRGGGHFDKPGEGRRGGFGGGRPSFGGGRPSFGGGKRFGGKPSFGGGRGGFGGGRDGGDREMFDTTCADCGKPCQVPFRPNGEKPVFCNDCFASKRGADEAPRRFERRDDRGGDRRDERPAPREEKRDTRIDDLAAQVRELHSKLDALVMIMDVKRVESAPAPKVSAEPKNAKTKKVEAAIAERKSKKVVKKSK